MEDRLYFAKSSDSGRTFGKAITFNAEPQLSDPQLSIVGKSLNLTWHEKEATSINSFTASSNNNGESFEAITITHRLVPIK